MKKYINVVFCLLLTSFAVSQNRILSLEDFGETCRRHDGTLDNVISILDINNSLDIYLGNWRTVIDNKEIDLFVSNRLVSYLNVPVLEQLDIDYLIRDSNGSVQYDTRNLTGDIEPSMEGYSIYNNIYEGYWSHIASNEIFCYTSGALFMHMNDNISRDPDTLVLHLIAKTYPEPVECPNIEVYPIFPMNQPIYFIRI